jgi:hypothetical protein
MTMQGWGVKTIAGLGMFAGWFLACAGDDIPPVEDDLRGALAQNFGGASMQTGSSGSGTGGRAGSGSGNGGRAGSANNAGSGDPGGGAAGDGGEPIGGGGSAGGGGVCDAFPILQRSCGLPGCHAAGVSQGEFAASEDGVVDFVDQTSTRGAMCGSFINSSNPEESLIYSRLFEAGCGNLSMPLTGDPLTAEESDCVLSWLQQFAE